MAVIKDANVDVAAQVEAFHGVKLSEVSPELLAFALSSSRKQGNDAFNAGNYKGEVHGKMHMRGHTYQHIWKCVELAPEWSKGYYRLGCASAAALRARAQAQAEIDEKRRALVHRMKQARASDAHAELKRRYYESIVPPEAPLADYAYRPVWNPAWKHKKRGEEDTKLTGSPLARALVAVVNAMAELDGPREALAVALDETTLHAYYEAIGKAVRACGGNTTAAKVLAIGCGNAAVGLLAAKHGASKVVCVERGKMLYRVAKQVITANPQYADVIQLIDSDLATYAASSSTHELADVVVIDTFDRALLGAHALRSLRTAREHGLVGPNTKYVPARGRSFACLVESRISEISGLDLSYLNRYQWHTYYQKVDLGTLPHTRLSAPFRVCDIDFTTDTNANTFEVEVAVTKSGVWNGIALWFELDLDEDNRVSSLEAKSWGQALQFLDESSVAEGQVVKITVNQTEDEVHFLPENPSTQKRDGGGAYACEISPHMAATCEETCVMNGFCAAVYTVAKDLRKVTVGKQADGDPGDIPDKADILVYEIFDNGLIGEGCFHLVAHASRFLLKPNATLLQDVSAEVCGVNLDPLGSWRWRPEYEGVTLKDFKWRALSDPFEVFAFDFYDIDGNLKPQSKQLTVPVTASGTLTAIAFWWDLQLDADTVYSTSPLSPSSSAPAWQQAVQWLREGRVHAGDALDITAAHDTFGIGFSIGEGAKVEHTGVELFDPYWKAMHDQLKQVVKTAMRMAARPADTGVDPSHAADFAMRWLC
eukprot:jgi/Chlat1/3303/Chrsp22S03463